ncbi:MAG: PAS domain S-box protein [Nitrospirota bacterium]|nr:PAS domain S-box protein [Nitrospirota bacterium]MDH5768051.1 PAS domain S-box protein [Nitrospirota bacterium]
MKDENKTKEQLIDELVELRQRISELEKSEAERKWAEEKQRELEKKYRAIFENTGTATIIFDDDMTISMINREAEKLSGYFKEEIEGKKKWTEFVVKDELERMKEYHRLRNIEPDVAPKNYEFQFIDREGNIKNILLTIDMIPGGKKRIASLLDITERKHAIEVLHKSEEELKKRVKKLEMFYEMVVDKKLNVKKLKEEIEKLKEELVKYKIQ